MVVKQFFRTAVLSTAISIGLPACSNTKRPMVDPIVYKYAGEPRKSRQHLRDMIGRMVDITKQREKILADDPRLQDSKKWLTHYKECVDIVLEMIPVMRKAFPKLIDSELSKHEKRFTALSNRLGEMASNPPDRVLVALFLTSLRPAGEDFVKYVLELAKKSSE